MPASTVIQVRRGTAAQWASANPVLAAGELGLDTTNNILKVGNGSAAWLSLPAPGTAQNLYLASNYR